MSTAAVAHAALGLTLPAEGSGVGLPATVRLTLAEWHGVPANPRQRNTERRARRARHLRRFRPEHAVVHMALLPDGSTVKIDGHTRDWLWWLGETEGLPDGLLLICHVYPCGSLQDAARCYEAHDNRAALETTTDQVHGATRELGLAFNSPLLASEQFAFGMRLAHKLLLRQLAAGASVYDLVARWQAELLLLDRCRPGRTRFAGGILAGALLSFRRYGDAALDFWVGYAAGEGNKLGDEIDPIFALAQRLASLKQRRRQVGEGNALYLVRCVLPAFERYRAGGVYSFAAGGIRPIGDRALEDWLASCREARR